MQKDAFSNVAVIRLMFFSYTTADGSCSLHPLRVRTVRQTISLTSFFFPHSSLLWFFYCSLPHLISNLNKGWALLSVFLCVDVPFDWTENFTPVYLLHPVLSHLSSHETHCCLLSLLSLCETGEEREEWRHASSCPSAQALRRVAPCEATLHSDSVAPSVRVEEPQSGANGDISHASCSPCHPRHCLALQTLQFQPLWQHGGPQQVRFRLLLATFNLSFSPVAKNKTSTVRN